MTYTLADATELAHMIFDHVNAKSGDPYMDHLYAVSSALEVFDEDLQAVGMLHSVLEYTDWNIGMLRDEGLSDHQLNMVQVLTRDRRKQTYGHYLRQVRPHEDAVLVKIACNAHNSIPERYAGMKMYKFIHDRIASENAVQTVLWPAAWEDDLRDILAAVNPPLLEVVDRLKDDGRLGS